MRRNGGSRSRETWSGSRIDVVETMGKVYQFDVVNGIVQVLGEVRDHRTTGGSISKTRDR
jgi:hypothetical protein